jgi:hypothetical protein
MAAARIGVPDYRALVEQRLQSAGELYAFMTDRFLPGSCVRRRADGCRDSGHRARVLVSRK